MLLRLSSSLPSAASATVKRAARNQPALKCLARFNSTDALAEPEATESTEPEATKKRSVPVADSLGDINIFSRSRKGDGQGDPPRRDGQRQRRPRPEGANVEGYRDNYQRPPRPPRSDQDRQFRPREQQRKYDGPRRPHQQQNQSAPSAETIKPSTGAAGATDASATNASAPAAAADASTSQAQTTPAPSAAPIATPKPVVHVQLEDLDAFFKQISKQSSTPVDRRPSQAVKSAALANPVVQAFLESKAGEYSRYVPSLYPNMEVGALGPTKLAELMLSRNGDVTLNGRVRAMEVVQKFDKGGRGAQASP